MTSPSAVASPTVTFPSVTSNISTTIFGSTTTSAAALLSNAGAIFANSGQTVTAVQEAANNEVDFAGSNGAHFDLAYGSQAVVQSQTYSVLTNGAGVVINGASTAYFSSLAASIIQAATQISALTTAAANSTGVATPTYGALLGGAVSSATAVPNPATNTTNIYSSNGDTIASIPWGTTASIGSTTVQALSNGAGVVYLADSDNDGVSETHIAPFSLLKMNMAMTIPSAATAAPPVTIYPASTATPPLASVTTTVYTSATGSLTAGAASTASVKSGTETVFVFTTETKLASSTTGTTFVTQFGPMPSL
ncbi:hypothetical protein Tdes44962_MAKER07531 [Teratosphaeria destructans]|uniref:Uncharacterized protein n=1 Tax=Teratosphaeria destructans TaxID=418781 RepID=A0A9W7W5U3_9PEZI|nr:hypothetical protein Tdes44962_MAKER07531 [Teratosphaeria destructans]